MVYFLVLIVLKSKPEFFQKILLLKSKPVLVYFLVLKLKSKPKLEKLTIWFTFNTNGNMTEIYQDKTPSTAFGHGATS